MSVCRLSLVILAIWLPILFSGCSQASVPSASGAGGNSSKNAYKPIDTTQAVFWVRQATEVGELLKNIASEFNAQRPGQLPIKVEHVGGYGEVYKKVSASIQAGELPAMAVAYQSMTAEYANAGAVVPFEPFLSLPQNGISKEDLADIFPVILETNKYPGFNNAMLSFPFCKSTLMLYFNKKVLADAGFSEPPKTWTEFLEQSRQIKAKLGKAAYAVNADCSTISGMIFSMGGEVVSPDGKTTLYNAPAALKVFELLETMVNEGLVYPIAPGSYDDQAAFIQDNVAFSMRSSAGRTSVQLVMKGREDQWGMAMIPQDDSANPKTVLYGPNLCIFATTPEQQRAAWEFARYFTSREISIRWALGTGYLPIRKSAADDPAMQKFWAEWPYNRAAYACLPFAKSEPNLTGWEEIRTLVETAETAILTKTLTARAAADELKKKADAVLVKQ